MTFTITRRFRKRMTDAGTLSRTNTNREFSVMLSTPIGEDILMSPTRIYARTTKQLLLVHMRAHLYGLSLLGCIASMDRLLTNLMF